MSDGSGRLRLSVVLVVALYVGRAAAQQSNPCAEGGRLTPPVDAEGIGGTGVRIEPADDSGVGETGIGATIAGGGGIGGTGIDGDDPDEGGIGGTGARARGDVAVFGTVTGFASICVGGTEIVYDATTRFLSAAAGGAADLGIGQVVAVVATGSGWRVHASEIELRDVLRGPVAAVDVDNNRIEALGQSIQLGDRTWTGDAGESHRAAAADFAVGDSIEVSGMRRTDGVVEASRIGRTTQRADVTLAGPLTGAASGAFAVAGVAVESADATALAGAVGEEVEVRGLWIAGRLQAHGIRPVSPALLANRVQRLQIEGFVESRPGEADVRIGGARLRVVDGAARLGAGQRVRVDARVGDGRIPVVERVQPPSLPRPAPLEAPGGSVPRGNVRNAPVGGTWGNVVAGQQPPDAAPPAEAAAGGDRGRSGPDAAIPIAPAQRAGRPESPPRAARPEKPDRPELAERPERPQRPERPERPQRPDRPERPQRPDRPERPQRPDRPERPERPQLPEFPLRSR